MAFTESMKRRLRERVLIVDVLAALFGMGAWLATNGMYTQLALLVNTAPESWNLSSYIVVLIQAANIGGVCYGLIQKICKRKISDSIFIFIFTSMGCLSLFLMAFFYSDVVDVGGQKHSVPLLALVFSSALVACTSSVLFIPYMNRFKETYLVSYMVGEGMSAFIPSIISLIQGVGGNPTCRKSDPSDPDSPMEQYTPPPHFSVTVYLIIISFLQLLSVIAFVLLKTLPVCKKEMTVSEAVNAASPPNPSESTEKSGQVKESHTLPLPATQQTKVMSLRTFACLLVIQAIVSGVANGLFPSIQSYSCLPYGNVAYHLSINLGSMANPLACYLFFFLSVTSLRGLSLLSLPTLAVAIYIYIMSTMSPTPPLVGQASGEALVVLSWVVYTGLVSYIKLAIASRFRKDGGKGLVWYGAFTQIGAAIGAVTGFVLLNYTDIFQSYVVQC